MLKNILNTLQHIPNTLCASYRSTGTIINTYGACFAVKQNKVDADNARKNIRCGFGMLTKILSGMFDK